MAGYRARANRYTKAGAYLGQVYRPRPTATASVSFRPCFVGKGDRLALVKNTPIRRSAVTEEALTFTSTPPYIANLDFNAKNDRSNSRLYKADGVTLATNKWIFQESVTGSGNYDQVMINTADYTRGVTYYLDYQSTDRDVLDPLPFSDPRSIMLVGNFQNQDLFKEGTDFVIPGDVSDGSPGSGNTFTSPVTSNITTTKDGASTGSVTFGSSNDYDHNYTRFYRLTVTGISAGPPKSVTFKLEVYNHSSGNSASAQVPLTSSCPNVTFTVKEGETGTYLDTNRLLQNGVYLTYAFGATNFVNGDKFEFWGYGPAIIEAHSGYNASNEQFSKITTPSLDTGGTSLSSFVAGSGNNYNDDYVRHYQMRVRNFGGTAATGTITLTRSGISDNEYCIVNNGVDIVMFEFKKTASYVATSLDTAQQTISSTIDKVVTVDISGAGTDDACATLLASSINLTSSWPSGTVEMTVAAAGGSTGRVNLTQLNYGSRGNNTITSSDGTNIACTGMSGATKITSTIDWAGWDELPYTTGSFTIDESDSTSYTNVTLEKGIKLTLTWPTFKGSTNKAFVAGDTFSFVARPAIKYYEAKDDRTYTLEITTSSAKTLAGTYSASTIEGGFGTWSTTTESNGSGGLISLNDNVEWLARNMGASIGSGSGGDAPYRHRVGDTFTSAAVCDDVIKWDINTRVTETIDSTDIRQDVLGSVTGTPNSYYLVLDNTPVTIHHVRNASTSADISYTSVANNPFIYFSSNPGVDVEVYYEWKGQEPDPNSVYYVTGTRLRLTTEYDQPVIWNSGDRARDGLAPSSSSNDILIMSEIADEIGVKEWYTCQVRDRDDDGIYTNYDYKQAILGTENTSQITDIVVLNKFGVMGTTISLIERCNDMFRLPNAKRMAWFGMPASSSIGDEDTANTTVYTSKQTLMVSGNSPAHGCYVLLGNTYATRTILLDDLSESTVTLDGSFVAGAACCLCCSFTSPAETLLFKNLTVFDTIEEFNDPDELTLGENNILYLHATGDGIYKFYESITTDNAALDYEEISAMRQKMNVERKITEKMQVALIGFVPPDPFSALTMIRGELARNLSNMASAGEIAPYGSEQNPPTVREINPNTDIEVFIDEDIKTDYYYNFWYNLRYPMKRVSGLYGVDSNAIMSGGVRTT